jgi:acyl-coenzyme A synthetase/AMP-(fatty) acid ligase
MTNVTAPVLHFGVTRRDAPALIDGATTLTYGELATLIRRTAAHLATLGLRPGDRVGLCLHDTAAHLVALLAVAHLGAVAAPLDWRAKPAENARFIAGLNLACLLVEPDTAPIGACPTLPLDAAWHAAVTAATPAPDYATSWQDPFLISTTSGSTGRPKFILMTHTQYYFAIAGMFELLGLSGRHRFLSTMPLYYSGGRNSCIAHLLRGDCVVLYPSLFTQAEYVQTVTSQLITVGGLVPSMVRQLLAAPGPEPLLPGLATLFCTGAPLHAEEKRQAARQLSPHFHERYGTAETLAISILRPADFATRADSVGQPHSLAEITIADEHDNPLPTGATGRLRYRGPGLGTPLHGIAENPNFRGGFYYPGEIARLDEAGYIFLQGRTSDVIMRSGAKFYPAEIEAVLAEHPAVAESAVLGQPGPDADEIVIAFVVPRVDVATGTLLAHCRARLTPHKVPRQINIVAELPKNTAGKIDKIKLAATLQK